MLTFISCAKTMASRCSLKVPEVTVPHFETEAVANALEMSQIPAAELEKLLRVNAGSLRKTGFVFTISARKTITLCRQSAHIQGLFLNVFCQKVITLMISVMRKIISVSLLFSMGCSARWMESSLIVWRVMYDCPKKAGFPCSIIGNRC